MKNTQTATLTFSCLSDSIALISAIIEAHNNMRQDAKKGDPIARSARRSLKKLAKQLMKQNWAIDSEIKELV